MKTMNMLLIVVFTFWFGCGRETDEHPHDAAEAHHEDATVVRLTKHQLFHIHLETAEVKESSVPIPLTLPGKVTLNDRRRAIISARLAGRVDKVSAITGDRVKSGQALAQIFSQEFLAMQIDYLQSLERGGKTNSDLAAVESIVVSARKRLEIVGLTEADLRGLEASKEPMSFLPVRAPFAGAMLMAEIIEGQFVELGAHLFEIADLSTLWVLADIYEQDLPRIHKGMTAQVEVATYPRELFPATLTETLDVVDPQSRTVKARLEVRNSSGKLKPEMFASVHLTTELGGNTIKVPSSAVLGETEKHFVFVAINDSTFERRDIRTGVETSEIVEVLDGLAAEERIVVRGGFFLKSELAKETFGEEH
jgi:RND family efflux transporter MFP subunit